MARFRVTRRTGSRDADVRAVLAGAASAAAAEVEDVLAVPPDPTAAAVFEGGNTMIPGAGASSGRSARGSNLLDGSSRSP